MICASKHTNRNKWPHKKILAVLLFLVRITLIFLLTLFVFNVLVFSGTLFFKALAYLPHDNRINEYLDYNSALNTTATLHYNVNDITTAAANLIT